MAVSAPPPHQYMKVLRKMSSKIIAVLPIDELLPYMVDKLSNSLLSHLNTINTSREDKVKYLLDNVEEGIKVGDTHQFDVLLQVMEEYAIRVNHNEVMKLIEDVRSLLVCDNDDDDVVTMPTPEGTDECSADNVRSQPTSVPMATVETQTTDDTDAVVPQNWTRGTKLMNDGYHKVFLCHDTNTGRHLMVKEICVSDNMNRDVQRIQTEIEQLKKLQHDHIVTYIGTTYRDRVICVFMTYTPGCTLRQQLRERGPVSEETARKYTRQLLEGVSYLHNNDILHGGITSRNIMIGSDGDVQLAEYGLYGPLQPINTTRERWGADDFWCYVAPELIKGERVLVKLKADIWSIGCTTMEMLTGHPPYHDYNLMAGIFKVVTEPMVIDLPPQCSDHAKDFLQSCFIHEIQDRPTASKLLEHHFV
ncbi:mitogen-activated protein kinase kinase kinase 3-like [Dysidea avara]|uniref:mitogen-activated protein kinase kinase kinase 3-like n=1 Tax=Dysidea avara TaxID=196820 RepID=UPI00332D2082